MSVIVTDEFRDRMIEEALKKLSDPAQQKGKKSNVASAVYPSVVKTLKYFCKQNIEFAEAILQSDKTVGECCEYISKGVGKSISDFELYQRAVEFYFPGAVVEFQMNLYMSKFEKEDFDVSKKSEKSFVDKSPVVLSLFDIMR